MVFATNVKRISRVIKPVTIGDQFLREVFYGTRFVIQATRVESSCVYINDIY
jgi:hypothetical protein